MQCYSHAYQLERKLHGRKRGEGNGRRKRTDKSDNSRITCSIGHVSPWRSMHMYVDMDILITKQLLCHTSQYDEKRWLLTWKGECRSIGCLV
jgi:hypothetical protein